MTTQTNTKIHPQWGGRRDNSGRPLGSKNKKSLAAIQQQASRHADEAITALASVVSNPSQPNAAAIATAASALLNAALVDTGAN